MTKSEMKELIYMNHSSINKLKLLPSRYKKEQIYPILKSMHKLTKLSLTMDEFENNHRINFVQPYLDPNQDLRCYVTNAYIVVELISNKNDRNSWVHIIEHHNIYKEESNDWYNFKILEGLEDNTLDIIAEGVEMVVETLEDHLYKIMNNKSKLIDQFNMIKIGVKSELDIRNEEELRLKIRKELLFNYFTKFKNIFNFRKYTPKITFS